MYKQRIRLLLIAAVAFFGMPLGSFAQQLSVHATTDTSHIRLGEPVKLQVEIKVPASLKGQYQLSIPILPDSFGHFEVVDRAKLDTLPPTAEFSGIFHQNITLTSFDSGQWTLPPVKYELILPNQSVDSAFTEPLVIDVNTVAVDTSKAFKPIKSIRGVAWNFMDYIWYFVALLAGILIAVGIWWFFLRKKKVEKVPEVIVPKETPYEIALRELHTLEVDKPWHQDVKAYYTTLTDVLRNYFEQQFKIAALEQTSAELLQNIKPVTILNQQREKLQAILTVADLAKFAKMQPSPEDHEDCLQKAMAIVEWTKPKAPVAAAPGAEESAPAKETK